MGTFAQLAIYFVQTLGSLCLLVLVLRLLMQLCRVSFLNPIVQFVYKATQPLLAPLRRIFPAFQSFDTASLIVALLVQWLVIQATLAIAGAGPAPAVASLSWAGLGMLSLLLDMYFYGLIAVVVMSWVAPGNRHPLASLLDELIEPVIAPLRRVTPSMGGIDLSPILMFLVINMLRILVANMAATVELPPAIVPGI